jgi:hypothetical protein
MDALLRIEFYTDRDSQNRIAVMAGDVLIFSLWPGQLDAAFRMCGWRTPRRLR